MLVARAGGRWAVTLGRRGYGTRFEVDGVRRRPVSVPSQSRARVGEAQPDATTSRLLEGPPVLIFEANRAGLATFITGFAFAQGLFWAWMAEWAFRGPERDHLILAQSVGRGPEGDVVPASTHTSKTGGAGATPIATDEGSGVVRVFASLGAYLPYVKPHEQGILFSIMAVGGLLLAFVAPRQFVNRLELRNKGHTLRLQTYSFLGRNRLRDVPLSDCKRGASTATGFDGYCTFAHKGWWLPYMADRSGFHKGGQRVFDAVVKSGLKNA